MECGGVVVVWGCGCWVCSSVGEGVGGGEKPLGVWCVPAGEKERERGRGGGGGGGWGGGWWGGGGGGGGVCELWW